MTEQEIERLWRQFRKTTATCNSIRTDEVVQFVAWLNGDKK